MKSKLIKFILIFSAILIVIFIALVSFHFVAKGILNPDLEYNLDDCIDYFDPKGRFQVVYDADCFIVDKKKERSIFGPVIRYFFQDNVIYVEFDEFAGYSGEPHHDNEIHIRKYGTYDINSGHKIVVDSIDSFDTKTKEVFENKNKMKNPKSYDFFENCLGFCAHVFAYVLLFL